MSLGTRAYVNFIILGLFYDSYKFNLTAKSLDDIAYVLFRSHKIEKYFT